MHVCSKGIIRAHRTHCGQFFRVCLDAIRIALPKDFVPYTKGEKIHTEALHKAHITRGKQLEVGQKRAGGYVTPACSGVPNAKRGENGPQEGRGEAANSDFVPF